MTANAVRCGKKGRVPNTSGSLSNQCSPDADSRSPSQTPNLTESSEGEDEEMENPAPMEGGPIVPHVSTDHRLELVVGKRWFGDGPIVRAISHCSRCQFTEANTCWSNSPVHVRDMWFKNFKKRYTWKAELEPEVKKGFKTVCQKRLKQMISKAARGDEPLAWMGADLHKSLRKIRETPEFKVRSDRARKNRISNLADENGKIDPGHRQGSMSTVTLASRMARNNKNKLPTARDLYVKGHSTKDKDGESVIVGKKAIEVKAKLDELEKEASQTQTGTPVDPNEIFYKAVGGWKKGVIPGLGTGASLFFKKPESHSKQSAAAQHSPSQIATLHQRLNDTVRLMQEQRELFETQLAQSRAQLDEQRNVTALMAKQIELMTQAFLDRCGSHFTPFEPRDHPDPDGSAGSAAAV